jgi:hypothetical protein
MQNAEAARFASSADPDFLDDSPCSPTLPDKNKSERIATLAAHSQSVQLPPRWWTILSRLMILLTDPTRDLSQGGGL